MDVKGHGCDYSRDEKFADVLRGGTLMYVDPGSDHCSSE
jgi:hypothetical protein